MQGAKNESVLLLLFIFMSCIFNGFANGAYMVSLDAAESDFVSFHFGIILVGYITIYTYIGIIKNGLSKYLMFQSIYLFGNVFT